MSGDETSRQPWIAVVHNPRSGAGGKGRELHELVHRLTELGYTARVFANRSDAQTACDNPMSREDLQGLVAAGGDGTLLDTISRFPGIPIAVLPLGTENLVARYLGVSCSGRRVAEMIAAGKRCRLDAARLGERRFTIMASAGFDAAVIHRAHAQRTGHITRWRYLRHIAQSIFVHRQVEMRVYADENPEPLRGRVVVVANLPVYAIGLRIATTAVGNDGQLDVRVFERGSILQLIRYFCLIRLGQHEKVSDVIQTRARRVRIESDEPVAVQTDGDPAGSTPALIEIEPNYAEFFIP